jgi:hypothetical protein
MLITRGLLSLAYCPRTPLCVQGALCWISAAENPEAANFRYFQRSGPQCHAAITDIDNATDNATINATINAINAPRQTVTYQNKG